MITVIDTNVLFDILDGDSQAVDQADHAMDECAQQGDLVLPMICYAELAARFVSQSVLDGFLKGFAITTVPASPEVAFLAGKLHAAHVRSGGRQGRVLPDFLIGAHALVLSARLLTRDKRFYTQVFHQVQALKPADFR